MLEQKQYCQERLSRPRDGLGNVAVPEIWSPMPNTPTYSVQAAWRTWQLSNVFRHPQDCSAKFLWLRSLENLVECNLRILGEYGWCRNGVGIPFDLLMWIRYSSQFLSLSYDFQWLFVIGFAKNAPGGEDTVTCCRRSNKIDPREKAIDKEFIARNYKRDPRGRIVSQPKPVEPMTKSRLEVVESVDQSAMRLEAPNETLKPPS